MSKLEELLNKECPDGVEYVELSSVINYEQPSKYIVENTKYNDDYDTPVLTAGQTFILGYTNEKDGIYKASKKEPVIIFDDFTTSFHWVDFNFKVKSSAMKMLKVIDENKSNFRYLYYCMKNIKYVPLDHTRQWIEKYSKFMIPLPPIEVQKEIVRILDEFTEKTTKLQELLHRETILRKKQYEYYNNKLLTFNDNVEYKTLEELCDIVDYRGKTPKKVNSGIFLITAKNIRKGYIDYEKSKEYVDINDYPNIMHRGLPQIGDVLITTEAPLGYVAQIDRENVALAQRVIKYRPKDKSLLSPYYLKYILLGKEFQDKLLINATGGTVKGIKGSKLHKLTIPVPPLEEQERIVNILDKFDALCNDITRGLPAEIEMRKKQYEYYRDKLLTFKEKKK
ncbi:type I restriction modification DNA specificity domain-containing protein [Brachyspira pilosicoli]|uniref:restriction endonuclease subunit S n=1 Tax=Brachyspira pilosicoli TaxID=52584 RepID=UPI000E1422BF|nr:restriction endonuclease subunit S [Brachyspira pilosicoli]SUW09000.1 type I restriction modification DNA specificity domain-containing protein [Brachyspira pilosicoli]